MDRFYGSYCLKDTAQHWDADEWKQHVSTPPGQWYTPDQICQTIYGPSSYKCVVRLRFRFNGSFTVFKVKILIHFFMKNKIFEKFIVV